MDTSTTTTVTPSNGILSSPAFLLGIIVVIAVGVYFLLRSKTNRIIKYDVATLINVFFLGAILVLINVIPAMMHELKLGSVHIPLEGRKDFTANQRNTISEDTIQQLRLLSEDVTATALYRSSSGEQKSAEDLFDQYSFYSRHFKYKFVDPITNRIDAMKYRKQMRIINPRSSPDIIPGTVILELASTEGATPRQVVVQLPLSGKPGDAEKKLTNGLFQLQKKDKTVVYFVTGHGEHTPDTPQGGLDKVKDVMQESMFDIKSLTLAKEGKVPVEDCVVIICGPQKDFEKPELDSLRAYVNAGGRLCALVDPTTSCPHLQAFLAEYGIDLGNDIVIDTRNGFGGQPIFPAIGVFSKTSPITAGYAILCYFVEDRSVKPVAKMPPNVTAEVVASTMPDTSFALKFDADKPTTQLTPDPAHDTKGPIGVCIQAVYKPSPAPTPSTAPSASPSASPAPTPQEGRIVVFGGSGFILEKAYLLAGNGDLFMRSINWLSESKDINISAHAITGDKPMILDETQKFRIWWISMFLIPGTLAMCGLLVFMAFKPN